MKVSLPEARFTGWFEFCGIANHEDQLQCPVCREDYVHIGEVRVCQGEHTSIVGYDHKAKHPTFQAQNHEQVGRGSIVTIQCSCEQGHEWDIVFGFHKGVTFCGTRGVRTLKWKNSPDGLYCPEDSEFCPLWRD